MYRQLYSRTGVMLIVVALLLALTVYTVSASPLEEKQQEQEALQEQLETEEEELEGMRQEKKAILAELQELEAQITRLEAELNELNRQISVTEEEIALTEEALAEAEAELEYKDELLKRRLRAIYEQGGVDYIEVLFNATSFNDFLTRLNDLRIIAENDTRLIKEVEEEKNVIEQKKEELDEQRTNLLNMRRDSLVKKENIEASKVERQQLYAALEEKIQEQEEAIAALEQEAEELEALIERLIIEMQQPPSRSGDGLIWPLAEFQRGWVTSGYGYRTNPITGAQGSWHGGIDIGIPRSRWPASPTYTGNPVYVRAAENGIVAFSGWQVGPGQFRELPYVEDDRVPSSSQWWRNGGFGYGRVVIIKHAGELSTIYAHNYKRLVNTGDYVERGQPIAIVGSTGWSTGPHLHFEVHENGGRVNPMGYLP